MEIGWHTIKNTWKSSTNKTVHILWFIVNLELLTCECASKHFVRFGLLFDNGNRTDGIEFPLSLHTRFNLPTSFHAHSTQILSFCIASNCRPLQSLMSCLFLESAIRRPNQTKKKKLNFRWNEETKSVSNAKIKGLNHLFHEHNKKIKIANVNAISQCSTTKTQLITACDSISWFHVINKFKRCVIFTACCYIRPFLFLYRMTMNFVNVLSGHAEFDRFVSENALLWGETQGLVQFVHAKSITIYIFVIFLVCFLLSWC